MVFLLAVRRCPAGGTPLSYGPVFRGAAARNRAESHDAGTPGDGVGGAPVRRDSRTRPRPRFCPGRPGQEAGAKEQLIRIVPTDVVGRRFIVNPEAE